MKKLSLTPEFTDNRTSWFRVPTRALWKC